MEDILLIPQRRFMLLFFVITFIGTLLALIYSMV